MKRMGKRRKERILSTILAKRKEKYQKIKKILFNRKDQSLKNFLHQIKNLTLSKEITPNSIKINFSAKKAKIKTNLHWINSFKKNSCHFKKYTPIKGTLDDALLTEKPHPSSKLGNNKSKLSKMSTKFLVLDLKSTKRSRKLSQQEKLENSRNSISQKKL